MHNDAMGDWIGGLFFYCFYNALGSICYKIYTCKSSVNGNCRQIVCIGLIERAMI